MGVSLQLKLLLLFSLIFSHPIYSQNIFVDSNQVAFFLNGSKLWSSNTQTYSISGGVAVGGILDFGYQYGSTSIEGQGHYNDDIEYDAHSFLVSVILTKKKMQVSIDLSITGGNSTTILIFGFNLARKYQLAASLEAVLNLSTGLAFNLQDFPQNQEFAFTLGADFFCKIIYFGPGIGYSDKEFFYGLNVGIVIPLSSNNIDQ